MSLFGFGQKSASKAKERLRMVLIQDRALLSPGVFDKMKEELLKVIGKYVIIDKTRLEINIDTGDEATTLIANIPIKQVRRSARPK